MIKRNQAIVIGSSITGSLIAKVLSRHYEQVIVMERDHLLEQPELRAGLPQASQSHVLLKGGSDMIEQIYPGFLEELQKSGGTRNDASLDWKWYQFGNWKSRFHSGMQMCLQSRKLLDFQLHKHLRLVQNVKVMQGCLMKGLQYDRERKEITGVRYLDKGTGAEATLEADLVVDASGRNSGSTKWLVDIGLERPEKTEITVDMCYASATFMRKELKDHSATIICSLPPEKKISFMYPVEDGKLMVSLAGYHGDHPPGDFEGFVNFAKNLPQPDIYNAIKDSQPLTPVMRYKLPSNLRHHYETLKNLPRNYLVTGDALMSFNPIYGQGMTVCANQARVLHEILSQKVTNISQAFYRSIKTVSEAAWLMATSEDLRYKETKGKRGFLIKALNWYNRKIIDLAVKDQDIARRFLLAMHFKDETNRILVTPGVIFKVLRFAFTGNRRMALGGFKLWL